VKLRRAAVARRKGPGLGEAAVPVPCRRPYAHPGTGEDDGGPGDAVAEGDALTEVVVELAVVVVGAPEHVPRRRVGALIEHDERRVEEGGEGDDRVEDRERRRERHLA